jgi:hypothetical protein
MAITVEQITNGSTGVFDVLMARVYAQLNEQFQAKRIGSKEYAEIYLGSLNTVLAQSIQYVTSVEAANNQAALILAQKAQVEAETQKSLVEKQLVEKNLIKADKEIAILELQLARTNTEKLLLEAKVKTEEAQFKDLIDGVAVAGIIGKQKELYTRQGDGFLRDAEQKLLKILSDVWSIQKSVDPNVDPLDTGMHDGNINVVALKAIQGIGATPVAPPPATP